MAKWFTVAPIFDYAGSDMAIGDGVVLSHNVRMQRLPEWVIEPDTQSLLNWLHRVRLERSTWAFVAEYRANSAFGSEQEQADRNVSAANLACWLARASGIKYEIVMHFRQGEDGPIRERARYVQPYLPLDNESSNQLTEEDHETASAMHEVICGMDSQVISTSLMSLSHALATRDFDVRYLQVWVAMEALFGPNSPGEIIHQIAERAALFLASTSEDAKEIYTTVKRLYGVRSRVAHGRFVPRPGEDAQSLCGEIESLLRTALRRILLDAEVLDRFKGDNREQYLKELAFAALPVA